MPPLPMVEKDGVLVIRFEDGSSLNEGQPAGLRQGIYNALEARKGARVVINLAPIDYISSTGIAFLIGIKRRVEAHDGRVVLHGLQSHVLELFSVMKLANLFEIASDEPKALELLSSPPAQ